MKKNTKGEKAKCPKCGKPDMLDTEPIALAGHYCECRWDEPKSKSSTSTEDNICPKCHKPLWDDGRFTVPQETCKCHQPNTGMTGWICPKCGAGLSPFTSICPCSVPPMQIGCNTPNIR